MSMNEIRMNGPFYSDILVGEMLTKEFVLSEKVDKIGKKVFDVSCYFFFHRFTLLFEWDIRI